MSTRRRWSRTSRSTCGEVEDEREKFAARSSHGRARADARRQGAADGHLARAGAELRHAFDIAYTDERGELQRPRQTSWGASTRLLGATIMVHGDDQGLRLPPRVAPTQVVVLVARPGEGVVEYGSLLAPLHRLGPERDTFATVPPVVLGDLAMDPLDPVPFQSTSALVDELPHRGDRRAPGSPRAGDVRAWADRLDAAAAPDGRRAGPRHAGRRRPRDAAGRHQHVRARRDLRRADARSGPAPAISRTKDLSSIARWRKNGAEMATHTPSHHP